MATTTALAADKGAQNANAFLGCLPKSLRAKIQSGAEIVQMKVRDPVHDRGQVVEHAYFPIDGGISNVFAMSDGAQVEVGMIGREGMAGFPAVLTRGKSNSSLYVQIPGTAWKVPSAVIVASLQESANSMQQFLRYVDAQLGQLSQYSACNRLHSLEERLARWLVMAHDRAAGDDIPLTQEFLALMLGVRRSGVTNAALTLQKAGVITYTRGNIVVLDRANLQAGACECYDAVEDRFEEQMGFSIRKYRLDQAAR